MWQFPCTRGKSYTSVDNFLNSVFHILLVTLLAQALILIVWGKYEVGSCLYSASLSSPHSETCRCHQETWECPGEVFKWTRINKVLWDVHGMAIRQDDFHPRWLGSCFHNALYWKVWGICGEIKKKWKRKLEVIGFIILFENKTMNFSAFTAIWLLYDQNFVLLSSKAEESPAQNKHSAKIIKFG